MYSYLLKELSKRESPIDVIVVGLGFMGFGFISSVKSIKGMRVPLIITRRPNEAKKYLKERGFKVKHEDNPSKIKDNAGKGYISVSSDLSLIGTYENEVVFEVTGTITYGSDVALRCLVAKKHLVTMNPELQVTVGSELKKIADKNNLVITDVIGDQPGSLARLISHARLQGFKVIMAGNMKRYLDRHATQEKMQPWADDKGLAVRQTVSFTDGTKQSIEMSLVANYFDMDVLQFGMKGPQVDEVKEALDKFDWDAIPEHGVVDYVIGLKLFPGVFVVAEHTDPHQQKYLRYLGLGDGPRYVLFEPYHLCHLEVAGTIAKVVLFGEETINNSSSPRAKTIAVAKFNLKKGQVLDGIGGDLVYGNIDKFDSTKLYLPIGLSEGAVLKQDIHQDQIIRLSDVELPDNAATRMLGLVSPQNNDRPVNKQKRINPFSILGL